ncbi:DUF6907 domain-containing protein [Streptomyces stelliscabiei]|uniref:DUF6907 domain-containing protein n=1 Tax=Streptomyces stelliscabiei TaxID=146820 RepID=UPI0029A42FFE|nr:hypothetical protein [Streptomyces stelliscabiei]MDX2639933.1 hypothetical protein [Streptomyces stelliscabiei]MDX2662847.1 hypothetical protein [Streptomyces stelliscabiei]MDX2714513.1 hypothetical protein [Streptomyces stelliscabiei]MDX2792250.1 hypothetical protein [Streptomyces stelliscabiei]
MTRHTVTLETLDRGNVTIPEPVWCAGHDAHVPVHYVDLTHYGPEDVLTFDGDDLYAVMLAQSPHSPRASRTTGVYVEQSGFAHTLDPAELEDLADHFIRHAEQLRRRARELAAILAGGEAK